MVATQLAAVLEAGTRLVFAPDPARPVFQCPDARRRTQLEALLTPEPTRTATQALLRHAVTYRGVLRHLFAAMADPAPGDAAEAARLLNAERECVDELGVALADAVRAQVAAAWTLETGRCPWCGDPKHESGDTGDKA